MAGEQTLAQRVRAKYPNAYADLSDEQLEAAVLAKYPGVYDDIPRTKPGKSMSGLVDNAWSDAVGMVTGAVNAVRHPLDTLNAMLEGRRTDDARHTVYRKDAWDAMTPAQREAVIAERFILANILQDAAAFAYEHPVQTALQAAPLARPVAGAVGDAARAVASSRPVQTAGRVLTKVLPAAAVDVAELALPRTTAAARGVASAITQSAESPSETPLLDALKRGASYDELASLLTPEQIAAAEARVGRTLPPAGPPNPTRAKWLENQARASARAAAVRPPVAPAPSYPAVSPDYVGTSVARPVAAPPVPAAPATPPASTPVAAAPPVPSGAPAVAPASPPAPTPRLQIPILQGETLDVPAAARTPGQMSPASIRMDVGLVARRSKLLLERSELAAAEELVRAGASPVEAVAQVAQKAGKLPELPTVPANMPDAPATAARLKLSSDEAKAYVLLLRKGLSHQQAIDLIQGQRALSPTTPAAAARANAEHNATGRWPKDRPGTK